MANKTWMKGAVIVVMAVIALSGCESKEQKAEKARIAEEQKAREELTAAFASLDASAIAEYTKTLAPELIVAVLKDADPKAIPLVLNNASPALVKTLIQANPTPASDFRYGQTANKRGIVITGYTGRGGAVLIPATIEDMPVLEIGANAFEGLSDAGNTTAARSITSLAIPDSVEVIGYAAFTNMGNLTRVTLPDGVKVIPMNTFNECRRLTTINLPASLETIEARAFRRCFELTDLVIPDNLTSVRFVRHDYDYYAFLGCQKLPIRTRQRLEELGYTGQY